MERTGSWHDAHKKLVWCTERCGRVVDFWVAFSEVVIIVRRLIGEGWRHYTAGKVAPPDSHDLSADPLRYAGLARPGKCLQHAR